MIKELCRNERVKVLYEATKKTLFDKYTYLGERKLEAFTVVT